MLKTTPSFEYENKYLKEGYKFVAGVDEAGRGPWAGPIVAAAVILPKIPNAHDQFSKIKEINDSKKLTEKKRNELDLFIRDVAMDCAVGEVPVEEIDEIGLQAANFLAFERAVGGLKMVDYLLIDGFKWKDCRLPYQTIIQGDAKCFSIAAASIIAKVYRDSLMCEMHKKWPEYRFDLHKGYGTKFHQEALKKFGPCELHRKIFAPIKELFTKV